METAVKGWFTILEAQFSLRSITVSTTKFYHVVAALPPDVIAKLPPATLDSADYDALKTDVVSMFEKTKPELFESLMKSSTITGKPSVFLQEMLSIAKQIGIDDQLVRHKFLQALPHNIAPVIASQKELKLEQLGKLADELMPLLNAAQSVNTVASNYNAAGRSSSPAHARKPQNFNTPRRGNHQNKNLGLTPYANDQLPKICRAHIFYASKARTCKPWCKWPGTNSNVQFLPNSRAGSPNSSRNSSPERINNNSEN